MSEPGIKQDSHTLDLRLLHFVRDTLKRIIWRYNGTKNFNFWKERLANVKLDRSLTRLNRPDKESMLSGLFICYNDITKNKIF